MTARTVLLIESAFSDSDHGDNLPLIADRRDDGGLTMTTLDEATRIVFSADDLTALLDYAGMRLATPVAPPAVEAPPEMAQNPISLALDHIRSIAVDGEMPTFDQYNADRPAAAATGSALITEYGKWSALAAHLDLTLNSTQQRIAQRQAAPVSAQAAAGLGPEHVVVTPHSNGNHASAAKRSALRSAAVAALRAMSSGSRMPSMKEYNARKPADLPRAGELMAALGYEHWGAAAKDAELVWMPGAK